jgi:hypothetical protein
MNRFNTLTQQGILLMYIPTIFMGKDANEETPEKNSMDWLGECPQSTRLAIDFWMFGQGPMDPMGF